jgi:hypothetical protein
VREGFSDGSSLLSPTVAPPAIMYLGGSPEETPPSVPGVEYTQHGTRIDNRDGTFTYTTSVDEMNTWNGTHWVRYVYDPVEKYVRVGNITIYHNEGGSLFIESDSGMTIGEMKWYVQAYYNDQWNNITLDNYQFVGFTKTSEDVSATQRFWGTQGEMNITMTYTKYNSFKILVNITNWASQSVPLRAIWAALDVSGLNGNYSLIKNQNNVTIGIQLPDASFTWQDVEVTTPDLQISTVVDKQNRRAAVIFGNISNVVTAGQTWVIDPTFNGMTDEDGNDDAWYEEWFLIWYWAHYINFT